MSETIQGEAHRRGRTWMTHLAKHGVYAHGRTLRATEANAAQALELVGVSTKVTLIPVTPELETLRAADDAREQALRAAVHALALRRTTRRDIAPGNTGNGLAGETDPRRADEEGRLTASCGISPEHRGHRMTHVRPYGFLRPAAQGSWNLHAFPSDPQVHRGVRTSDAPTVAVPST
ncbi:hypothetical protein ACIQPR_45050 [Streptomyces sp. NPDC091280]|uniref:hypothetical protein n=1 Tax=Streptomyces sp. NPDC091280 TaxID=3365984 RepID=UPI0037F1A6FC